jgi:hypothetical protein
MFSLGTIGAPVSAFDLAEPAKHKDFISIDRLHGFGRTSILVTL